MPGSSLSRGRWAAYKKRRRPRRRTRRNYKRRGRGITRKYIQSVANRGKERLHISYNIELIPSPVVADAANPGKDKSFATSINSMSNCYNLRKNPAPSSTGDNVDDVNTDIKWGHNQTPGFSGDYVFYQQNRGVLEIGLLKQARGDTGDGFANSDLDSRAPWLVRVICVTPKDCGNFSNTGFRSLNGEKIGIGTYQSYTNAVTAEAARFDVQQLIKNGMINKADFKVHMDTRFELGAGNVAQTVSKKIPFKWRHNKNVKYESVYVDDTSRIYNPSDLDDGSKAKKSFDRQWYIFACPSVYDAGTNTWDLSTPPINVCLHGVTLALD